MDIEELKRRIDSLDARLTELEGRGNTDEQMAKIKVGRIVTARDRLVRRRILFGGIYDGFVSDDWHKED